MVFIIAGYNPQIIAKLEHKLPANPAGKHRPFPRHYGNSSELTLSFRDSFHKGSSLGANGGSNR
jgi:hypothetical protein